ncbi:hypothetical protein AcV5_003399 [Taiwanofungus camphoratus]|nr:hypothetical protein AcV5_003399 [Antrodia cinnamomea]
MFTQDVMVVTGMSDEAPRSCEYMGVFFIAHGARCHLLADTINIVLRVDIVSFSSIPLDSTFLTDNADMIPYLPPEVTDYIIDFLWYDFRTLYNCALVCHAWLPRSRLYLQPSLYIRDRSEFDAVVDDVLHDQRMWPYYDHIQSLEIQEDRQKPYVHVVPHLLAPRMSKLRVFTIWDVDWCNQTRPHPSFFRLIARFRSVTCLNLVDCKFPAFRDVRRLVCGLPQLTKFTWRSKVTSNDVGARYPILARPRLRELSFYRIDARELAEWCCFLDASASARTIRTLFLGFVLSEEQDRCDWCSAMTTLLKSLGDVLHVLTVPVNLAGDQCNLEHNHSLQSLTISWSIITASQWPIYWDGVARLLSHVASNHVQELEFRITLTEHTSSQQGLSDVGDADAPLSLDDTVNWDRVNDVITHERFNKMRAVDVLLTGSFIRSETEDRLVVEAKSQLHRTAWHARGILHIVTE